MALPVINDVFRCSVEGSWDSGSDSWTCVYHVLDVLGTKAGDTVADDVGAAWIGTVLPELSNQLIVDAATALALDGNSSTFVVPHNDAGNSVSISTPHQCAAVISLATGIRGRSNRGRSYLPGMPNDAVDAGDTSKWTVGTATLFTDNFNAFISALDAVDLRLVVASYVLASARQVTSITFRPDIFTQRRRVGH
jgi:hypothetical protein